SDDGVFTLLEGSGNTDSMGDSMGDFLFTLTGGCDNTESAI
ncbi:11990_t:CDS:1, partial [Racocetra fulgida]